MLDDRARRAQWPVRFAAATVLAIAFALLAFQFGSTGGNQERPGYAQVPAGGTADPTGPTGAKQQQVDRASVRTVHAAASGMSLPHPVPVTAEPLPPPDTPLRDILQELERRASAGEPAAACRLAEEIARCASVQHFDAERDERLLVVNMSRGADLAYVDSITEQIAESLRMQERCTGVPEAVLEARARHDLAAAKLGDVQAAYRFLGGWSVGTATLIRDPGLATLYREQAWPLFLQLLEAGHPYAAFLWKEVSRGARDVRPLAAVMPAEWRRPEVAEALATLITGRPDPHRVRPIAADAQSEAAHLFQAYFAASPHYTGGPPPPPALNGDPSSCDLLL